VGSIIYATLSVCVLPLEKEVAHQASSSLEVSLRVAQVKEYLPETLLLVEEHENLTIICVGTLLECLLAKST